MVCETRRFNALLTLIYLRSILVLSSYLRLRFRRGLFPVSLPVNIFKELLSSSILAIRPAYLNFLDYHPDYIQINGTKPKVLHDETFSFPHSHLFWVQIFASGSCFPISLV